MTRLFQYYIKRTSDSDNTGQFRDVHLYIQAKPRFTLGEAISKQNRVAMKAPDLPWNKVAFTSAVLRGIEHFTIWLPGLAAVRKAAVDVDRSSRTVDLSFDVTLEFVFDADDESNLQPLLGWLRNEWGGEWKEVDRFG